jgi:hypothetical protein
MSGHQQATIEDTVYFWFGANDTSGSGGDGASPLFDVREAGAAADAIPLLSGTPTLLSHANYPAGCYEVCVEATTGNGFAANDTFAVFCTLTIDSQNPTGFVGSCTLTPLATAAALSTHDGKLDTAQADLDIITGTSGVNIEDGSIVAASFGASAITSTVLADNCITAAKINADAITSAKIADNALANEHFANGALTSTEITSAAGITLANDAITAAKIAANAITSSEIADDAITAAKLATGALTADAFAADAIVAATLATNAITDDAWNVSEVVTDSASRTASKADVSSLATTAELNKVPKSDGTTSWNATALGAIQGEAQDALDATFTFSGANVDANVAAEDNIDFGATKKASINTEVDNALDTAIPGSPTGDSINDYINRLKKVMVNQMEITEANGNVVIRNENDVDAFATVNAAFTSDATTTTRKRLE